MVCFVGFSLCLWCGCGGWCGVSSSMGVPVRKSLVSLGAQNEMAVQRLFKDPHRESVVLISPLCLTPRPPPLIPRQHYVNPPSVPVPDMAWGYEEVDGVLTLQQPPKLPGSACGPGAYSPTDVHLRKPRCADFTLGSGRDPPTRPASSSLEQDDDGAETEAPSTPSGRQPMPIAAMRQHSRQQPRRVRRAQNDYSTPGPGAFAAPLGMGATGRVRYFPQQNRHRVLPELVVRHSPRIRRVATLHGSTVVLVPLVRSPRPMVSPRTDVLSIGYGESGDGMPSARPNTGADRTTASQSPSPATSPATSEAAPEAAATSTVRVEDRLADLSTDDIYSGWAPETLSVPQMR